MQRLTSPGPRFTNGFSIAIQIRWKFRFILTSIPIQWSLQNFVHGTTAVLSWHVQKFVAIRWPATELWQGEVSIEFDMRAKKVSETGPWAYSKAWRSNYTMIVMCIHWLINWNIVPYLCHPLIDQLEYGNLSMSQSQRNYIRKRDLWYQMCDSIVRHMVTGWLWGKVFVVEYLRKMDNTF